MRLHYRVLGENNTDRSPIIILHGVFGTSDNWQSFGKELSERHPVFLIDQRNHGLSPHSDVFDYPAMADDLQEFVSDHRLRQPIVLGHSMGGKTAMFFAIRYPDLLSKLIVVDIAPRAYPVHHQSVLAGLGAVAIEDIQSRKEAEEQMKAYVPEAGVRQFLLKNLKRTDSGFDWKLNLPVIRDNIEKVGAEVTNSASSDQPSLFVRGEQSDYIQEEDEALIQRIFPAARLVTIAKAGHWIHAEQPEVLLETVTNFIEE